MGVYGGKGGYRGIRRGDIWGIGGIWRYRVYGGIGVYGDIGDIWRYRGYMEV